MTLQDFYRLMRRNWLLLLMIPLVTGASIFLFTRNIDREYASDTIIYTGIASGFSLTDETSRYEYASSAFSNLLSLINSRDTWQEVALRLLASHLMLSAPDPAILSAKSYERLKELIPEEVRRQVLGASLEETAQNLFVYAKKDSSNVINFLLYSDEPGYSFQALSKISSSQVGASDLIQIGYVSNDAAMCRHTLEILSNVFMRKHRELMEDQSGPVTGYFQEATARAYQRVEEAEQKLLEFHKANNLINFSEQASTLAAEKQQLIQSYNDLEMQYAGALSAVKAVERSLKGRAGGSLYSQEIIQLRNQLAALNTQTSELEAFNKSKSDPISISKIRALKQQAAEVSNKLRVSMDKYYATTHTAEGMSSETLLNDWIKNTVLMEELKGKLVTMRKQRDERGEEYNKIAPLGADMRKIEREIELAEKEYFTLLDNLTKSKLAQQNIGIKSQLKVVDPPYMPVKPKSSKRLLLMVLGIFGTFFIILGGMVAGELLNSSVKNASTALRQTDLPIFGTMPLGPKDDGGGDRSVALSQASDVLARQLLLKAYQKDRQNPYPFVVGMLSSQTGEGKTTVLSQMATSLQAMGIKTLVVYPDDHALQEGGQKEHELFYSPLNGLAKGIVISELAGKHVSDYDVVLVEFPAVLGAAYPVSLLKHLDLVLITMAANRAWTEADKAIYENIQKITQGPIEVLVNGVLPKYAEDSPKKFIEGGKESSAKAPQQAPIRKALDAIRKALDERTSEEVVDA